MYDKVALAGRLTREETDSPWLYDDKTGERLQAGHTIQGNVTGGIGRNFFAKPLSPGARQYLLGEDLVEAEAALDKNIPWWRQLDDVRQSVMMDLEFNMGWSTLSEFAPTLALVKGGDYTGAAQHLRAAPWYRQVGSEPGQRGYNLALAMESGVMPA